MNIKLTIKDTQNNILQTAIFREQETLDDFIALIANQLTFGKPAYDEIIEQEKTIIHPAIEGIPSYDEVISEAEIIHHPEVPAVAEWAEIIPAVIIHHKSEYVLEIVDITAEVEAKRLKRENKKIEREGRIKEFNEIDWSAVTTIAHLKAIVKQLVKESLRDEE